MAGAPGTRLSRAPTDISVVIPTLDEAEYLPHLLDSLDRQTVAVREVIVVDAASTDTTVALARARGARVIEGGGLPGFSRNVGAGQALGEWLLFLDADVRLAPDTLERMIAEVRRARLDAASTAFVPDHGGPGLRLQHRFSSEYFWLSSRLGWSHSIGGFLFVRRSLHERIGGFDEGVRVAEDQDYALRLGRAGRYRFTRRPVVEIAARRFDRQGLWRMSAKWLAIELHRMLRGEIRSDRFGYFAG
jgi:glycosyltransferase involved in cell wall biosynthesis